MSEVWVVQSGIHHEGGATFWSAHLTEGGARRKIASLLWTRSALHDLLRMCHKPEYDQTAIDYWTSEDSWISLSRIKLQE